MFWQKITFVTGILLSYIIIIVAFILYPRFYCTTYNITEFYTNNDTTVCMVLRYSLVIYYAIVFVVLLLTLIASYTVKTTIVNSPYYFTPKNSINKKKRKNILVFIPAYSESKEALENTIDSVLLNDYPLEAKTMFIVVDGKKKGKNNDKTTDMYAREILDVQESNQIIQNDKYTVYAGEYQHLKYILMIKETNCGKKDSFLCVQKIMFYVTNATGSIKSVDNQTHIDRQDTTIIDQNLQNRDIELSKQKYLLMLDTDTKVDASGLRILADYLDSNPFTSGVCGETSLTNKGENFVAMSQYFEYYITHYTLKSMESVFGNVLVLSGCFALYRVSLLLNKDLIEKYSEEQSTNIYNANITQLGEDRLFTNLLLQFYPKFTSKYIEKAKCYTEGPTNIKTLLCQRRRWTNSLIFCNWMLLRKLPMYSLVNKMLFGFILFFELWIVLYMPLLLTVGYYYAGEFIYKSIASGVFDPIMLGVTIAFIVIPVIMSIILGQIRMVGYAMVFIFILPIFSIIVPLYSMYKVDDVSWGETRKVDQPKITDHTIIEIH